MFVFILVSSVVLIVTPPLQHAYIRYRQMLSYYIPLYRLFLVKSPWYPHVVSPLNMAKSQLFPMIFLVKSHKFQFLAFLQLNHQFSQFKAPFFPVKPSHFLQERAPVEARADQAPSERATGHTALHAAADAGHLEVLQCLLESRAETWPDFPWLPWVSFNV